MKFTVKISDPSMVESVKALTLCAYCGKSAKGSAHTIHRDGWNVGPLVPLCLTCGDPESELPTNVQIWRRIRERANLAKPPPQELRILRPVDKDPCETCKAGRPCVSHDSLVTELRGY